jgi:hypothetical protein
MANGDGIPEEREALPVSNEPSGVEQTPIAKATVDSYARALTLEVGAGSSDSMWITWHYSLTDEGGSIERRSWQSIDIRKVFNELVAEWRRDTALESFVTKKVMHFAYQSIIGLGPAVVPLLLESLAEEPRDWFWALAAISREDPAVGIDRFGDAARAWLQWGRGSKELPLAASG